jgi:hypothetical protein
MHFVFKNGLDWKINSLNFAGDDEFKVEPVEMFIQVVLGGLDHLHQYDPLKDIWLKLDEYSGVQGTLTLKCKTGKFYSGFYRRTNKQNANQTKRLLWIITVLRIVMLLQIPVMSCGNFQHM